MRHHIKLAFILMIAGLANHCNAVELHLSDGHKLGERIPKLAHKDPTPRPRSPKPSRCKGRYNCEACYARRATNHQYSGYYVGGSGVIFGHGQRNVYKDGTWGVDYVGLAFKRHVWLHWLHDRHDKGGLGAYEPDGPHVMKAVSEAIHKE